MPNLAGCDGCEGGGFFEEAAAVRFRGAMASCAGLVFEAGRPELGGGGRRPNGEIGFGEGRSGMGRRIEA